MNPFMRNVWRNLGGTSKVVGSIVVLVSAIVGITQFVDWRVAAKLNDPSVLRELSKHLQPTLVFDVEDRILVDMGGLSYIESIHVELTTNKVPTKIVVTPKKFLAQPPLITPMDAVEMWGAEQPTRGKGITWVYNIGVMNMMADMSRIRFRLEVIP